MATISQLSPARSSLLLPKLKLDFSVFSKTMVPTIMHKNHPRGLLKMKISDNLGDLNPDRILDIKELLLSFRSDRDECMWVSA